MNHVAQPLKRTAARFVQDALADVCPPGVPLCFDEILSAEWQGQGKNRRAIARVRMFDGAIGCVEVRKPGLITSHRWLDVGGSAVFWSGRAWAREKAGQ